MALAIVFNNDQKEVVPLTKLYAASYGSLNNYQSFSVGVLITTTLQATSKPYFTILSIGARFFGTFRTFATFRTVRTFRTCRTFRTVVEVVQLLELI